MSRYGYGYVPEKGFVSFLYDLSEGAWKDISIKKFDRPVHKIVPALLDGSPLVVMKLRATWSAAMLRDAIGVGSEALLQLDDEWDSLQRSLNFALGIADEAKDKARRDASARLRAALMLGNGTAQTNLGWDEEVDFGRQQLELTAKGPLADDAKTAGLKPLLKEIGEATEALARGLGRGPGQRRAGARAARIRDALTDCVTAFNCVHGALEWLIAHAEPDPTRYRLEQLLAPFQALLDRYAADGPSEASAEPEPVPARETASASPPA